MKLIGQGNSQAFHVIYQRYSKVVFGYCFRLLEGRSQAEDASQEVWIKVVRAAEQYEEKAKLTTWLCSIARNTSLNLLAKNGRLQMMADIEQVADERCISRKSLEDDVIESAELEQLEAAIKLLPQAQKIALTLLMTEDLSYEQIAVDLKTSEASVKSLLFRARKNLESSLKGSLERRGL